MCSPLRCAIRCAHVLAQWRTRVDNWDVIKTKHYAVMIDLKERKQPLDCFALHDLAIAIFPPGNFL